MVNTLRKGENVFLICPVLSRRRVFKASRCLLLFLCSHQGAMIREALDGSVNIKLHTLFSHSTQCCISTGADGSCRCVCELHTLHWFIADSWLFKGNSHSCAASSSIWNALVCCLQWSTHHTTYFTPFQTGTTEAVWRCSSKVPLRFL